MDSSSSSDSEAAAGHCSSDGPGDAWDGDCSGQQGAQEAEAEATGFTCNPDPGSQDSPPAFLQQQQQQQGAASWFSFPGAGQEAAPLQYITPLKIPQPPGKHAGRAGGLGGQHTDTSSRSSSPGGSYIEGLHRHSQCSRPKPAVAAGEAAAQASAAAGAAAATQHNDRSRAGAHQPGSSRPGSSPVSTLPSPSAASSMSSEAAALLQALKLAAEQRKITQGVLTARSSFTSGLLTADMGSGAAGDQPTPSSRPQLQLPTSPLLPSAPAGDSSPVVGAQLDTAGAAAAGGERGAQAQRLRSLSPNALSSHGGSVQGPLGPLPRSNSVLLLQRSAAEQLLQDAVDSSSFSSLMALLDIAAGSGDEDEVQQQQQPKPAEQQRPQQAEQQEQAQEQHSTARAAAGATGGAGDGCAGGMPAGPTQAEQAEVVAPRAPSIPESHSTWGSCFSTPLGGNSRVFSPRGKTQAAEQGPQGASQGGAGTCQAPATPQAGGVPQQPAAEPGTGPPAASPPLSSAVSWAASEAVSEALSTELEQLQQQVEVERQQLNQLRQQRSQLELVVGQGSGTGRQQQGHAACGTPVATPDEVSPQSIYLECTEQQQQQQDALQQQQQHEDEHPRTKPAAADAPAADVAVQCDDSCLQLHAKGGAKAQGTDAACQALLLHVAGLPAVGPPIECRACPVLHKQLQETQQRLEAALEQHKQVGVARVSQLRGFLSHAPAACCLCTRLLYLLPTSPLAILVIANDVQHTHYPAFVCVLGWVPQAQLAAQQSRQQAMTAEAQLALTRQKLRQQVAAGARPLAMSGWEDLVDEAAADLEKVEGHVAAAAQRLIQLQVCICGAIAACVSVDASFDC